MPYKADLDFLGLLKKGKPNLRVECHKTDKYLRLFPRQKKPLINSQINKLIYSSNFRHGNSISDI